MSEKPKNEQKKVNSKFNSKKKRKEKIPLNHREGNKDRSYKKSLIKQEFEPKIFHNLKDEPKKVTENIIRTGNQHKRDKKITSNINKFRYSYLTILILSMLHSSSPNNITLKIRGTGEKSVFSSLFGEENHPDRVIINDIPQRVVKNTYYLNEIENTVILIWNKIFHDFANIFLDCTEIYEINLFHFNTSEISNFYSMFKGCSSLTSINLTNLNTSKVTCMSYLFSGCSLLTSLNLSSFNTENVEWMDNMFSDCFSLLSLNLSNFNTENVKGINHMFYRCSSLISLDLSSFYSPNVYEMNEMFYDCSNLGYLNIENFNGNNLWDSNHYKDMFINVPSNLVICMKENSDDQITSQIKSQLDNNLHCHKIDCSGNWLFKRKKIIVNNGDCLESCKEDQSNYFEDNGKCLPICQNNILEDNICKCPIEKCDYCPSLALNKGLCTKCNEKDNYYAIENDPTNIWIYINCYKEPV